MNQSKVLKYNIYFWKIIPENIFEREITVWKHVHIYDERFNNVKGFKFYLIIIKNIYVLDKDNSKLVLNVSSLPYEINA